MEKKVTQRVVGVLVIVALVVILLPLLFGKNEVPTQQVTAKAPAFPDQPAQAPTALADNSATNQSANPDKLGPGEVSVPVSNLPHPNMDAAATPASTTATTATADASVGPVKDTTTTTTTTTTDAVKSAVVAATSPVPASSITSAGSSTVATSSSPTAPVVASNAASTPIPDAAALPKPAATLATDETEAPAVTSTPKVMHKAKTHHAIIKAKASKLVKPALVKSAQFKQPAWAVQMGNFKNKDNARRLTDALRAAGYKAFTRDYKLASGKGVRTRVYIGPEFKQSKAVALSNKVEDKLRMRGIVVSYKPLEL